VLKLPHSDIAIGVTGEQGQAVHAPAEARALWWRLRFTFAVGDLNLELLDELFLFQVPDLDGRAGGSAQPVSVWREHELADLLAGVEAVEWVSGGIAEVPQLGGTVFATGCGERSIGRDSDRVDVATVAAGATKVGLEVEVAEVPDLDLLVPTAGNDDWVGGGWAELNGGDPFGVAVLALLSPLALAKSIPELDGLITAGRDDLSVVSTESNAHNVFLVASKRGAGYASLNIPKSEGLVPRSRHGELTARTDDDVTDKVVVSFQSLDWYAIASLVLGQTPDDERVIAGTRDEHLWVDGAASNLGDPATVALKGTAQIHYFT